MLAFILLIISEKELHVWYDTYSHIPGTYACVRMHVCVCVCAHNYVNVSAHKWVSVASDGLSVEYTVVINQLDSISRCELGSHVFLILGSLH